MADLKSGKLWNDLAKKFTESQVWTSSFRHGYADTPRNRVLQIASNVWLHLHPVKIHRHALRIKFTWCMGGITFLLFLSTVVTGVILMFYYRPVGEYAYFDMKYLQYDVPFGMLMRNMHRWAAHAMVITVWLHMFRVFLNRLLQATARIQLGHRRVSGYVYFVVEFYRLSASLGSAGHVGGNGWYEYGPRGLLFWDMRDLSRNTFHSSVPGTMPGRCCWEEVWSDLRRYCGFMFCTVFLFRWSPVLS